MITMLCYIPLSKERSLKIHSSVRYGDAIQMFTDNDHHVSRFEKSHISILL